MYVHKYLYLKKFFCVTTFVAMANIFMVLIFDAEIFCTLVSIIFCCWLCYCSCCCYYYSSCTNAVSFIVIVVAAVLPPHTYNRSVAITLLTMSRLMKNAVGLGFSQSAFFLRTLPYWKHSCFVVFFLATAIGVVPTIHTGIHCMRVFVFLHAYVCA